MKILRIPLLLGLLAGQLEAANKRKLCTHHAELEELCGPQKKTSTLSQELKDEQSSKYRKRKLCASHAELEKLCGPQKKIIILPQKTKQEQFFEAIEKNDDKAIASILNEENQDEENQELLTAPFITKALLQAINLKKEDAIKAILSNKTAMSCVKNLNSALFQASKNALRSTVNELLAQKPSILITKDGILNAISATKCHIKKENIYDNDKLSAIKGLLEVDPRVE